MYFPVDFFRSSSPLGFFFMLCYYYFTEMGEFAKSPNFTLFAATEVPKMC